MEQLTKVTRTKSQQKFSLYFILLEATYSFICNKNVALKFLFLGPFTQKNIFRQRAGT